MTIYMYKSLLLLHHLYRIYNLCKSAYNYIVMGV